MDKILVKIMEELYEKVTDESRIFILYCFNNRYCHHVWNAYDFKR